MRDMVVNMGGTPFLIAIVVIAAIALAAFVYIWVSYRRYRWIHDTPTAKVRSATQGYVELEGIAQDLGGEPIISPLTQTRCVWWKYTIEKRRADGKGGSRWVTVKNDTSDALFQLQDSTGVAVIDPDGAEVSTSTKRSWSGGDPFSNNERPFGLSVLGGSHRYTEWRIAAGSPLYILGAFTSIRQDAGWDRNLAVREKLLLWKQDQQTLLNRFDANRDGEIDMEEWQEVRKAAKAEIDHEFRDVAQQPAHNVLGKPKDRRPFIIATEPQDKIAKRYLHKSLGGTALFFIALAVIGWMFSVRLG